jgi:hypothetical protein
VKIPTGSRAAPAHGAPSAGTEARRVALRERAQNIGELWAQRVREELRDEQRMLSGGWPGTISEARARAFAHFSSAASVGVLGVLNAPELESASREVYARARQVWLAGASNDAEP